MSRRALLALLALPLSVAPLAATEPPLYRDPAAPVEQRVADLLSRMTLEEKVAQMVCLWEDKNRLLDADGHFDAEAARKVIANGVGQIARPSDNRGRGTDGASPTRTPTETVELVNDLQRFLRDETRLGIPALMHEEGLHGYAARWATSFPQAIALAASWDRALVEEVYTVAAREIRVRGAHQVLSPVVDVARDPRWGRIEETYGEDPFLVSEIGLAAVRGFQGTSLPLADGRVLVTLKHMTGHGQPENGTNVGPAALSERLLREVFFPPFERAVREGGALNVMASYNEIDGIPSHVNRWLLGDVLRGEWGFSGAVVADYYALQQLGSRHHVVESMTDAAMQALAAGVDVELPNPAVYPLLVEQVRTGAVAEALIDEAVARILRLKFLAGLFEEPFADAATAETLTGNAEARALALRAAERSIILLENRQGLLPLDPKKVSRVAVVGPNAAETILGGYTDVPRQTVSLLDGVRARLGSDTEVVYAEGARITEGRNWWANEVTLADADENRRRIAEAVELAKDAQVVLLAIGDNEQTSREAWDDNHLGDRSDLDLVGQQQELFDALVDSGVPVVVVLIHGRPLAVPAIAERAAAVVDGWYLGQETGTALAAVLFGDVNPGGKLPVSVPRSVGQLPIYHNHKPTARRGYLFDTTEPLWPFGHGLSYTTFSFDEPSVSPTTIAPGESATLSVEVTNTGSRAGDEVVQLYLRDVVSSVTRPVRELAGFERITLEPGGKQVVRFSIGTPQLQLYDRAMQRVVEPGSFELMVGSGLADLQTTTLTVVQPSDSEQLRE